MKQLTDISSDFSFYLLLGFVFMINLSIAGAHILFTLLCIQLIIYYVRKLKQQFKSKNTDGTPIVQAPSLPMLKYPGYYKFFLLYILFSFVSTLFALDKTISIKDNREFFQFLLIPIFLLVLNSKKRLKYSFYVLITGAVLNAIRGLYQVYTLPSGKDLLNHRPIGFTSHWMTFAGLLMFVFLFFFVYLFYQKKIKTKFLLGSILSLLLTALFFSLTRSVWVGMAVALGIFIIYFRPKILFIAIPLGLILVFLLPTAVKSRFVSIFDMKDRTNMDRFYMYAIGVEIFRDYPLTGVGADNIKGIYNKYRLYLLKKNKEIPTDVPSIDALDWSEDRKKPNSHLHNNVIHILAERGIFSLLSLSAAFIAIFILLIKRIRNTTGFEKTVALGSFFAFIGFLLAGMFEYNFGDTEIKFILFYFVSIPFLTFKQDGSLTEHLTDNTGIEQTNKQL